MLFYYIILFTILFSYIIFHSVLFFSKFKFWKTAKFYYTRSLKEMSNSQQYVYILNLVCKFGNKFDYISDNKTLFCYFGFIKICNLEIRINPDLWIMKSSSEFQLVTNCTMSTNDLLCLSSKFLIELYFNPTQKITI